MVNRTVTPGMYSKCFAAASDGGRIIIEKGVRFVQQATDMHVYCYSKGEIDDLKKAMCVNAPEPYDACLEIVDPAALLAAVADHGEILPEGSIVNTIFKDTACGSVTYQDVSLDIRDGPAIPSAYKKARTFKTQREHRLVLQRATIKLPERFLIKIPDPSKHFREVFRDFKRRAGERPV